MGNCLITRRGTGGGGRKKIGEITPTYSSATRIALSNRGISFEEDKAYIIEGFVRNALLKMSGYDEDGNAIVITESVDLYLSGCVRDGGTVVIPTACCGMKHVSGADIGEIPYVYVTFMKDGRSAYCFQSSSTTEGIGFLSTSIYEPFSVCELEF